MALRPQEFQAVVTTLEVAAPSQADDAVVNAHCADLEACLASLSKRQTPVQTRFRHEEKMQERREEFTRSKPIVEVHEQTRTVPRLEFREVQRVVEVPHVHYMNKYIEVPELRVVEKLVEVPQLHIQEVVKEVPRVQIHEIVRHIPRIEVQEIIRQVPKVEVRKVEKIIEVPQIQTVEKIVEVPTVQTVEKIVHVPHVQTIEKIVPVERVVQVEKPIYASVAPLAEKVELLNCVTIGGTQVPIMTETLLMSMSSSRLREHACLLYSTLGHSIVSPVPAADTELISWIVNVQRQHVEPFRENAPSLTGYQALPGTVSVPPLQSVTGISYPLALSGVDGTNAFSYVGANGIVHTAVAQSGSLKTGSISMTPRVSTSSAIATGAPLQERTVSIGTTSSDLSAAPLNLTRSWRINSGSLGNEGSLGAPISTSSGVIASSGVTRYPSGRASGNQNPPVGSVSVPTGTPRRLVNL